MERDSFIYANANQLVFYNLIISSDILLMPEQWSVLFQDAGVTRQIFWTAV